MKEGPYDRSRVPGNSSKREYAAMTSLCSVESIGIKPDLGLSVISKKHKNGWSYKKNSRIKLLEYLNPYNSIIGPRLGIFRHLNPGVTFYNDVSLRISTVNTQDSKA